MDKSRETKKKIGLSDLLLSDTSDQAIIEKVIEGVPKKEVIKSYKIIPNPKKPSAV